MMKMTDFKYLVDWLGGLWIDMSSPNAKKSITVRQKVDGLSIRRPVWFRIRRSSLRKADHLVGRGAPVGVERNDPQVAGARYGRSGGHHHPASVRRKTR